MAYYNYKIGPNVVNGHTFTCSDRYAFHDSKILGRGSFGVVTTSVDSESNKIIAIKRIRPYANDDWDARHTLREVRLMRFLGPHPNVISLYNLSLFDEKSELYMMMELMDCDLHRVIQSKQALTPKHYKCFLKQIIEGIKAMHEVGVFHRDLKPGNILVSKDCQIRITDFGLARFMDENTRQGNNKVNPMTEYVVTRWYRAPELLLSPNNPYDEAIDLWSIGCILAELYRRKPLFPGKSHAHQVQMIFEVMGYNAADDLGFVVTSEASGFLEKRCVYRKQPLQNVVPGLTDDALELLELLLSVNPAKRPTAAEAIKSRYLDDADVICDYSKKYVTRPTPKDFEFEQEKFTLDELRSMIVEEVRYYENLVNGRPPVRTVSSSMGSYAIPVRGSIESFSTTSSRKGSSVFPGSERGDDSVRSSWESAYSSKIESRDEEYPMSQMQTQRPGQVQHFNSSSRSYIPPDKLLDKLSALRVSGGNVAGVNAGIAAANTAPDTDDLVNESYTKAVQDSTAIDIRDKPRRSSIRGVAVGSIIASARNVNSNSPNPRTPLEESPMPSNMPNPTNVTNAQISKANPKFRQRLMSTSSVTGSIPTSTSQGPTSVSEASSSLSRSYGSKSSLAAAGAAMVNGGTSTSLDFHPRHLDPLASSNGSSRVANQYQPNQTSQSGRKNSTEFAIFSQLHGKYQSYNNSKVASGNSSDSEDAFLDASDGTNHDRKVTTAPDRRSSTGYISQSESESLQQSKGKSFIGMSSLSRR